MTKLTRTPLLARFALTVTLASMPALAAGVDPGLLALVPPDTKTLAGIRQGADTPFGQTLLDLFNPAPATKKVMADIGFDPRRDLREVLAASPANLFSDGRGVLLLGKGSFHPDKIGAAGASAGAVSSSYRGIQLIEAKGNGPGSFSGAVAFPDSSTVLAGETSMVKAALDRNAAKPAFSGALADRVRQIAAANDAWLVSSAPEPGSPGAAFLSSQLGPVANLLQAAVQFSAGVKFAAAQVTVSADIVTRTPQDAQAMVDILKFGIQMLASGQSQGQPSGANSAAAIVQAARISTDGSTLHAVLPVPQQFLEQFFGTQSNGQPKKIAAR